MVTYTAWTSRDELRKFDSLVTARKFIVTYGNKYTKYPIFKSGKQIGYVFFDKGIWGYYDRSKQMYFEVKRNGSVTNGSYWF